MKVTDALTPDDLHRWLAGSRVGEWACYARGVEPIHHEVNGVMLKTRVAQVAADATYGGVRFTMAQRPISLAMPGSPRMWEYLIKRVRS